MFGHQISRKATFGERTEAKAQPGANTQREEEEDEGNFIAIRNVEATSLFFCGTNDFLITLTVLPCLRGGLLLD